VKRRGPSRAEPLSISIQPTPVLLSEHARLSRRSLAEVATQAIPTKVVA
jgi:protein ImuA